MKQGFYLKQLLHNLVATLVKVSLCIFARTEESKKTTQEALKIGS